VLSGLGASAGAFTPYTASSESMDAPPQYIQDELARIGVPWDPAKYRWDQERMNLVDRATGGQWWYGDVADPARGVTYVLQSGTTKTGTGGTLVDNPLSYLGLGDAYRYDFDSAPRLVGHRPGETFLGTTPEEIADYRHDQQTRMNQAVLQIAALVGGAAAAGGAFGGGAAPNALPSYTGATTAAGLPTGAAGAAGGGLGTLTGAVPAVGASPGLAAGLGGAASGLVTGPNGLPTAALGSGTGSVAGGWLDRWLPYINSGVTSLLGANAADRAADAESEALQRAIDEQRRQYDLNRQDLMPWLTAGTGALGNLQNAGTAFTASPGYDWRRSEGQRDIGNSFAARGGAASGNALRALAEFNQGLASSEFNNWYNQQAGLAGVGQNTAVNLGNLGQNTAGNIGTALTGQGLSRASGIINRYGALGQGLTDSLNWLQRRRLGG
jgi:hypothetical protein